MFAELIGQRLGNYRIIGKLGEGGIATVYRAEQLNIQREVAIKVMKTQDAQGDFLHRLEREAATIARLSHPHIVKLFDYGQENGITYLVMELITGGSLADLIRTGALSPFDANRILQQLASALDYAHREGIIHRDLKPHNVLMDSNGNALLTDFGLARLVQSTSILTQSGTIVGTPAYMAPEQWTGGIIDARTDVYALGVILFEMLTGRLPFNGETPYRMMHMHINEKPPYIHTLNTTIPLSFDAVISKALAKDIARRFDSAGALAAAFQSATLDEATIVVPAEGIQETITLPQTEERRPAAPSRRTSLWLSVGILAVVIILLAFLGLNYLGGQDAKAQPIVLVSSPGTPTLTPNVETLAAATFAGRLTMTVSLLSQTPDEQETLVAVVGATDTANAIASYTATA
ncbi:MAG TPA: protein kinase, partial [Aggregatilineales bacterium]|nr:protein kinase [Aggregatilineales bacterium]